MLEGPVPSPVRPVRERRALPVLPGGERGRHVGLGGGGDVRRGVASVRVIRVTGAPYARGARSLPCSPCARAACSARSPGWGEGQARRSGWWWRCSSWCRLGSGHQGDWGALCSRGPFPPLFALCASGVLCPFSRVGRGAGTSVWVVVEMFVVVSPRF